MECYPQVIHRGKKSGLKMVVFADKIEKNCDETEEIQNEMEKN